MSRGGEGKPTIKIRARVLGISFLVPSFIFQFYYRAKCRKNNSKQWLFLAPRRTQSDGRAEPAPRRNRSQDFVAEKHGGVRGRERRFLVCLRRGAVEVADGMGARAGVGAAVDRGRRARVRRSGGA